MCFLTGMAETQRGLPEAFRTSQIKTTVRCALYSSVYFFLIRSKTLKPFFFIQSERNAKIYLAFHIPGWAQERAKRCLEGLGVFLLNFLTILTEVL